MSGEPFGNIRQSTPDRWRSSQEDVKAHRVYHWSWVTWYSMEKQFEIFEFKQNQFWIATYLPNIFWKSFVHPKVFIFGFYSLGPAGWKSS